MCTVEQKCIYVNVQDICKTLSMTQMFMFMYKALSTATVI